MNIQQLEYILAVDIHRHFATAAQKCFVTQPTLSMMIQKLEEELGVKIFDRTRQPVEPTDVGLEILRQARKAISELRHIQEIAENYKGEVRGDLRVGIIPTLSPYLLPLFLTHFLKEYPNVKMRLFDLTTQQIIDKLSSQELDVGIMATPLNQPSLKEEPLFYEQFVVFTSARDSAMKKKYLLAKDIDVDRLWLLEEGHCLRSQVINLCELKRKEAEGHNLDYEAGSIETLKKIVDISNGITILPELAVNDLTPRQQKQLHYFKAPAPVRQISLVTYRHFSKKKLVEVLREEILKNVPAHMKKAQPQQITEVSISQN
jgi:LysR family hydrogen peroxide-inducible transcriptional activator